jgi:hypothetical protein
LNPAAAAAQAAIVSVVVLVILTPVCVAILAGLAAARDALSGPGRQSKLAGSAQQESSSADGGSDPLGSVALEAGPRFAV